jgi:predicted O-methyltransferase YrrM
MKFLEAALAKVTGVESRLANYVLNAPEYSFSQDYVTDRAPAWIEQLGMLKAKPYLQMLEIGSFEGRSAIWFLANILTDPSSVITCVDPFLHRITELRFDHNVTVSGFSARVVKLRGRSQQILKLLKENNYDLVYIDGSHCAGDVETDALLSWPLVKCGGIVIFDDYLWNPDWPVEQRPQIAIDHFIADLRSEVEILHRGYQVMVRKVAALR